MLQPQTSKRILPAIVISQFLCTSIWFAGNAVMPDIIREHNVPPGFLANITSAVQFGFITGTLFFAALAIADRFSPSRVFLACSILAALANLGICLNGISPQFLLLFRFLAGFFLAGIYPVGMKIAADHFQKGLGRSLGFLVGALVLGTAFPHLLKSINTGLNWRSVIIAISALCLLGGLIMQLLVPDGPHRKAGSRLKLNAFVTAFKNRAFRSPSIGYFGHMWELYTFWAFLPVILEINNGHNQGSINIALFSFLTIASGAVGCFFAGLFSQRFGPGKIAVTCLSLSAACCLLSPLFLYATPALLTGFLFFWGLVVTADSPMFSTLVSENAPAESRGAAITIVTCIGFSITIVSIQLLGMLSRYIDPHFLYMLLAIGPVAGLVSLYKNKKAAG